MHEYVRGRVLSHTACECPDSIITMAFNVQKLADADNTEQSSFAPSLQLFDKSTQSWIPARESCPPETRWDEVDYDTRVYRVAVCHLTQFGLYFQYAPVAVVSIDEGDTFASYATATSQAILLHAGNVSLSAPTAKVMTFPHDVAAAGNTYHSVLDFDQAGSHDPDGFIVESEWKVDVMWRLDSAAATDDDAYTLSSTADNVTRVEAHAPCLLRVSLLLTDNDNATKPFRFFYRFNARPVARFPDQLVHMDVGDVASPATASGLASYDPEGVDLSHTFSAVHQAARYAGAPGAGMQLTTSGAPMSGHGSIAGVRAGNNYTVTVTVDDLEGGTDTTSGTLVVNARPVVTLSGPAAIWLPDSTGAWSVESHDVDGQVVRSTWSLDVTPSANAGALGKTGFGGSWSFDTNITKLTKVTVLNLAVDTVDNDGGVTRTVHRCVAKHQTEAKAGGDVVTIVDGLADNRDISLDGSASYDLDGTIKSYTWSHVSTTGVLPAASRRLAAPATAAGDIINATTPRPALRNYAAGEHLLRLTVVDSMDVVVTDDVLVRVLAVAHAGVAKVMAVVPASSVELSSATSTVAPGATGATEISRSWHVVSAPAGAEACGVAFTDSTAASPTTTMSNICVSGNYTVELRLVVRDNRDNSEHTATSQVWVRINAPPEVTIGPLFHGEMVVVAGTPYAVSAAGTTDDDGWLKQYLWGGSSGLTFADVSSANTMVTAANTGDFVLTFTATDGDGLTSSVSVTLRAFGSEGEAQEYRERCIGFACMDNAAFVVVAIVLPVLLVVCVVVVACIVRRNKRRNKVFIDPTMKPVPGTQRRLSRVMR